MTVLQPSDDAVAVARSIVRLNTAYTESKVLQSAVELGVFPLLDGEWLSAAEIIGRLSLHPRLAGDFLDALHGLGLLDRSDGQYTTSAVAAEYLIAGKPYYVGGTIAKHADHHFLMWGRLTEALRDGEAKSQRGLSGKDAFHRLYEQPERVRALMNHMDAFNGFIAQELATVLDWSGRTSFVDVAGARGNLAARLVQAHPHLTGTVFDLPPVEPFFDELIEGYGLAEKIRFHGGDVFVEPIPKADVAIIGHTLHDWPVEDRQRLIERIAQAVRPGGALLVYDPMIADERSDTAELTQSLMCALMRDGASEYTVGEARAWGEKAGFRFVRSVPIASIGNDVVVVLEKTA